MFKFRRDSLCAGLNDDAIATTLEQINQEQSSSTSPDISKDILDDSISESRLPSSVDGELDENERESLSLSESSSDSLTTSSDPSSSAITCVPWTLRASRGCTNEQTSTMPIPTNVLLDRKRKERNESWCAQEQETKVIRGCEADGTVAQKLILDAGEKQVVNAASGENAAVESTNLAFAMEINTDEDNGFGKSVSVPQSDPNSGIRTMPISFEPELQRQWERTATQWNARKIRRSHRPRHSRSSKSFSEVEEVIKKNFHNLEELSISPPTEKSASLSVSVPQVTFEDESLGEAVELDLDTIQTSPEDEDSGLSVTSNCMAPTLPTLEFSTLLHHQAESDEPVSYSAALHSKSELAMLSPRNSITLDMDPNIAPSPPVIQFLLDPPISKQILNANQEAKLNSLSKHISSQKKQLKRLEEEHAKLFGGNLSRADKLKHPEMSRCINQINKAKRAIKQIREDPSSLRPGNHGMRDSARSRYQPQPQAKVINSDTLKELEATVSEAEKKLERTRITQNRTEDLVLMTTSELKDEKDAIQKQLILLEKRHGRPEGTEKNIVRVLYDRYRAVKRILGRATIVKENSLDLAPIFEYEALDLSQEERVENRKPGCAIVEIKKGFGSSSPKSQRRHLEAMTGDDYFEVTGNQRKNEDFGEMNMRELHARLMMLESEKRQTRSSIRVFETAFAAANGRPLKKGEKCTGAEVEALYQQYKHVRATIRLIRILINKPPRIPGLVDSSEKVED